MSFYKRNVFIQTLIEKFGFYILHCEKNYL